MDQLNKALEVLRRTVESLGDHWPGQESAKTKLNDALMVVGDMLQNGSVRICNISRTEVERLVQVVKHLVRLFEKSSDTGLLDQAVTVAEIAGASGHQLGLNTLARALGQRFEAKGTLADLDRAISVLDGSRLKSLEKGDPDLIVGRNYLAILLGMRFEHQGDIDDLDESIRLSQLAVEDVPPSDPDYISRLQNLANRLAARAQYKGKIEDIDDAIRHAQQALRNTPPTHDELPKWWGNLGAFFGMRYNMMRPNGNKHDLKRGMKMCLKAINLARKRRDVLMFGALANTLANILRDRYQLEGDRKDDRDGGGGHSHRYLHQAVHVLEKTLSLSTTPGHEQAILWYCLGETLKLRYQHAEVDRDAENSIQAYQQALSSELVSPAVRISAATELAEVASFLGQWTKAATVLEQAVGLLHILVPRHLQNENKQQLIRRFSGVSASAAAAALNAGKDAAHALGLLELGRGIIAGFLLDAHTDITALKRAYPDLADEFSRLSLRLAGHPRPGQPSDGSLSSSSVRSPVVLSTGLLGSQSLHTHNQRWRRSAGQEMEALLAKIRKQPGFERFLLPPTTEQMMAAADPDPVVVVNVSSFRCDAFLVKRNQIQLVRLPKLHQEKVMEQSTRLYQWGPYASDSLLEMLQWLWHVLVRPVLNELGFTNPPGSDNTMWPRVWWVPVGPLSALPLHAAGIHRLRGGYTALDRVVSSYSSSIKALIAGRASSPSSLTSVPGRAVLVSMSRTPNYYPLEFAEAEVEKVGDLCLSLGLQQDRPPRKTQYEILYRLRGCRIFHFAGHGVSDQADPSRSHLMLEDWESRPLTVDDLRSQWLSEQEGETKGSKNTTRPFLAYLSACSTAANGEIELSDEAIHLVNGFQLAGFRHVVGTLWTVNDKACVDVAEYFYKTLCRAETVDDGAVCHALHVALRHLRGDLAAESKRQGRATAHLDTSYKMVKTTNTGGRGARGIKSRSVNLLWVPYVHYGV
ncbi:hypothetical protein VTH82DRAFT_912 [Thermothelomyces myriococcoides]